MAGKIYVTGDCHGDFRKLNTKNFPAQATLTEEDYLIICGDFGTVWGAEESSEECWWLNWLESKPFTTLFVDGNHENFDRLYAYPVEKWHGGKVHKIRPTVIHLMRGQIYELAGKKIFTFGGAQSHDLSGGILDMDDPDYIEKKRELDKEWVSYRINHISWWKEELPSEEEMREALENLEKNNFEVDYIFTHCCSTSTQELVARNSSYSINVLTEFFEGIKDKCRYNKWYFGHYHDDLTVNNKEILFYDKIVELDKA
jgi:hypothetical protein